MDEMRETVERIEAIAASTERTACSPDGSILKTLGNHLCDLLQEGECLEIELNFECVSGLSVTAVAKSGKESTIGIGPEHMVRQADKDRFAEAVAKVLAEARSVKSFWGPRPY